MAIDEEKDKTEDKKRRDILSLKQVESKTETKSRLTMALRENLIKRKIQKRSRKNL